eukprot:CAMPEP_0197704182 /NCGR_PEP_ID=MMETSP1338-20131121/125809_1 /TAXON_ID=43686 ORGANISM="Pelagodinium beii, Strain RCC1491" /NCGR_SAMPLE_ID=MMETSP1338 /ASSEMBLY_ACC=CAM_ASM_000754 /LENGTH=960 /DNA_ID=CAMNT_0043288081 /DNA_START=193 /DNA_END=3076 /DNA_ORIENTATION=-
MTLRSARLDGSDVQDVIVKQLVLEAPHGIAVDPAAKKVYWTSPCCGVHRGNLDGSDQEVVASSEYAGGIALDAESETLYWTDWMQGKILQANMSGSEPEVLIAGHLASPVDIAIDLGFDMVYYSDIGLGRVERASFEGTGVQTLNMSWAKMQTYGVAIDSKARKIYLSDYEHDGNDYVGRIVRTNLDGSESEVIVSEPSMSMPYGVAVDSEAGMVYWTDKKAGKIQRLALRCANGTIEVAAAGGNSSQVQVPHEAAEHGSSTTATCPGGYNGTLLLACNNGEFSVSAGKCGKRCPAGSVVHSLDKGQPSAVDHRSMDDGEVLPVECPGGLIGTSQIICSAGTVWLQSEACREAKPCRAGGLLMGDALVSHDDLPNGLMDTSSCPQGFQGQYFLLCQDGNIVSLHNGTCQATCDAGSLWVDGGAVEVLHGSIIEGSSLRVVCPTGSAGDGVYLSCTGGLINITKQLCSRTTTECKPGSLIEGFATVLKETLPDNQQISLQCPDGYTGSLNVTCNMGVARLSGSCHQGCAAGLASDSSKVALRQPGGSHGELIFADCPKGYTGSIAFKCHEGNLSMACDNSCTCHQVEVVAPQTENDGLGDVGLEDLPLVALAATATAAVLLLLFGAGLFRHRLAKRRAMAEAVAAVGEMALAIPSPACKSTAPSPACASTTVPCSSTGSGSSRDRRIDTFDGVVIEKPVALPLYWATKEGVQLFPDTNRISEVQQLMTDSWRACYTRDRRLVAGTDKPNLKVQQLMTDSWRACYTRDRRLVAGTDRVPIGCRVVNVLRVENHGAYTRYAKYKESVAQERGHCTPFPTQTANRINLLDDNVNERYLFHGTNPEAAHGIAKDFFRIDRAGSSAGCMFGRGIYLAENASKSDEYAKEGAGVYVGLCAMLLCRAVLGEVLTVSSSGDMEAEARAGRYDCVCGDRLAAAGTYREMVFFNEEAVYPEFIVIYAQLFE